MSATVLSLNSRKVTNVAMLGMDLPIRLMLVPEDSAEPLDDILHEPLVAFIKRWMRREFEEMRGAFFTQSLVVPMMLQILDGKPIAGYVQNLAKHKIRRIDLRNRLSDLHWYYDVGGMLALGQVKGGGFVASVTYHPLVAGYYVKLPNFNGEIGVLRVLD